MSQNDTPSTTTKCVLLSGCHGTRWNAYIRTHHVVPELFVRHVHKVNEECCKKKHTIVEIISSPTMEDVDEVICIKVKLPILQENTHLEETEMHQSGRFCYEPPPTAAFKQQHRNATVAAVHSLPYEKKCKHLKEGKQHPKSVVVARMPPSCTNIVDELHVHLGTSRQQQRVRTCFATCFPQFFPLTTGSDTDHLYNSKSLQLVGQSQHQFAVETDQQGHTLCQDELFSTRGSLS